MKKIYMKKKTYSEKAKEIEIIDDVDVMVVGGGPAGIGAAIGSARCGASTMIVEAMGSFGGMWTNGLVITLAGFNNWLKPYQRCVNGIMGEWIALAEKVGGAENNRSWVLNSDPEIMKLIADELLMNSGVMCLLHTWMADVIVKDNHLKGILIENVDGRKAIMAKVTVDCTGNGDVFARAGESFEISQELQPMTLPFYFADVVPQGEIGFEEELVIPIGPEPGFLEEPLLSEYTSRRRDIYVDREKLKKAARKGEIPFFGGPWFGGLRENLPWVNMTRVYGSAINAKELTAAEMEARKNAYEILEYYRKEYEGFKTSWIVKTASTIGIRETRRLNGVTKLKKEDVIENHKFKDSVAVGVWPIDVHPPKGRTGMHPVFVPAPYQIPYRAMLPGRIENLIVGGRCISVDREALGSVRVGATCGAVGHAAGIAAALSASSNRTPRSVNYKDIQRELLRQGGIIE
jgi:ribulose 1,5-bisphosphate synthetase/thiazole synthase